MQAPSTSLDIDEAGVPDADNRAGATGLDNPKKSTGAADAQSAFCATSTRSPLVKPNPETWTVHALPMVQYLGFVISDVSWGPMTSNSPAETL
jgi:hypothetical protein